MFLLFSFFPILYNVIMNRPVIVITGPTASGKTDIASRLCKHINGEIISADSRQIYRYLDIGTNKSGNYDSLKRLRLTSVGIPQHLTDIIDPDESFSAGGFVREASLLIKQLTASGKTPVIVGGTGLYIRALVQGLAPLPPRNDETRLAIISELETQGIDHIYYKLKKLDPDNAEKNRLNPQRLVRALEICLLTGKPVSELHAQTQKPEWQFLQFAVEWQREELYLNIDNRSKQMLSSGMIEETKNILSMGYDKDCAGFGSLGYRHVIDFLSGGVPIEDTQKLISIDTRHYAKRQMTWFRREADIHWIKAKKESFDPSVIAAEIANKYNNMI